MKAIILAAGQGTRLRPYTNTVPKCMVKYKGKEMVDYQLEAIRGAGIDDITIVKGYLSDVLEKAGTKSYINPAYDSTNMVESLFCAEQELNDDVVISYSDIVYDSVPIEKLVNSSADAAIIVDKKWYELWSQRMEDPLSDAETLKLNDAGEVIELGKKPSSLADIEAQYVGLIMFKKDALEKVKSYYHGLDRNGTYDGKDFKNMYMTSFLQGLIDDVLPIKAEVIQGGWTEVDSVEDLEVEIVR